MDYNIICVNFLEEDNLAHTKQALVQRSLEELLILCIPHIKEYHQQRAFRFLGKLERGDKTSKEELRDVCWDVIFGLTAEVANMEGVGSIEKIAAVYDFAQDFINRQTETTSYPRSASERDFRPRPLVKA